MQIPVSHPYEQGFDLPLVPEKLPEPDMALLRGKIETAGKHVAEAFKSVW